MGSLDGVLMTNPAWIDQREIVEVVFLPMELPYADLVKHAIAHSCDQMVFTSDEQQARVARELVGSDKVTAFKKTTRAAKASDRLYYLNRSPYRFLPLTPLQARRVNSALHGKRDPGLWLSPRQMGMWRELEEALKDPERAKFIEKLVRPDDLGGLAAYERHLLRALRSTD